MNVDIDSGPDRDATSPHGASPLRGRPIRAEVSDERRRDRRRHAARHLADGERPEAVAAWMRMSMSEVYELMGTMEIDG